MDEIYLKPIAGKARYYLVALAQDTCPFVAWNVLAKLWATVSRGKIGKWTDSACVVMHCMMFAEHQPATTVHVFALEGATRARWWRVEKYGMAWGSNSLVYSCEGAAIATSIRMNRTQVEITTCESKDCLGSGCPNCIIATRRAWNEYRIRTLQKMIADKGLVTVTDLISQSRDAYFNALRAMFPKGGLELLAIIVTYLAPPEWQPEQKCVPEFLLDMESKFDERGGDDEASDEVGDDAKSEEAESDEEEN